MQTEELRQLAEWMRNAGLYELNLTGGTVELRMQRAVHTEPAGDLEPALTSSPPAAEVVTSSCCGHFYRQPLQASAPMIADGLLVEAGEPIGIIVVGDLSLPVISVTSGVAQGYLVEDGQLVEYGTPLLAVQAREGDVSS